MKHLNGRKLNLYLLLKDCTTVILWGARMAGSENRKGERWRWRREGSSYKTVYHKKYWLTAWLIGLKVRIIGRKGGRDREIETSHLWAYSPNDHNNQRWASPKSTTKNLFWIFHIDIGAQVLWLSLAAFSGALAGHWIGTGIARVWTAAQLAC